MSPITPPSPNPAASCVTPNLEQQLLNPSRDSMLQNLGRDDLVVVCKFLDAAFHPGNWALTGSTALWVHAKLSSIPEAAEKMDKPADADFVVTADNLERLSWDNLPNEITAGFRNDVDENGDRKAHVLIYTSSAGELKVDLIPGGRPDSFADARQIDPKIKSSHSMPVLSLDALRRCINLRIGDKEDKGKGPDNLSLIDELEGTEAESAGPSHEPPPMPAQANLRGLKRRRDEDD